MRSVSEGKIKQDPQCPGKELCFYSKNNWRRGIQFGISHAHFGCWMRSGLKQRELVTQQREVIWPRGARQASGFADRWSWETVTVCKWG